MTSEEKLSEIFSKIGNQFGYETVSASFTAHKDLKVRWSRSHTWAEFTVSDYLDDAPEEVIEDLAVSIFSRICQNETVGNGKLAGWVNNPDFARRKQSLYLGRIRTLTKSLAGECKDLRKSYDRLIASGLLERDPDVFISWTKGKNKSAVSKSSHTMKVIGIPSYMDADDVPDFVVDFCLFREMCGLRLGYNPEMSHEDRNEAVEKLAGTYERAAEARRWLSGTP